MSVIVENKLINRELWSALVRESSVATWFQTPQAYDFYDGLSFFEAFAVAIAEDECLKGVVVGYVQKDGGKLKQFFSRRAIVIGGPLLSDDITSDELALLLTALKSRLSKKAIFIETRNFNDYSQWCSGFEKCGFQYQPHYDVHVDTTSLDVINDHLGKSRKRDIRVSIRDGATIIMHPDLSQIQEYYGILKELYKTKVKTPLVPFKYFEDLLTLPTSVFLLIEYNGRIVGGTVCVGLPGVALYEMYVCGEDGRYKNIFPSEIATFAGLKYAAENDYPKFDMMGAGYPNDGGYGVRDFKLKFGGVLYDFGRFVFVCDKLLYALGKLIVKIIKHF